MFHTIFAILLCGLLTTTALAQIPSVENADGSYSIGINADSGISAGDAVLALVTKSAGWTETSKKIEGGKKYRINLKKILENAQKSHKIPEELNNNPKKIQENPKNVHEIPNKAPQSVYQKPQEVSLSPSVFQAPSQGTSEKTGLSKGYFDSHLEVLQLLETFLNFKREFLEKFVYLIRDNYDMIERVSKTVAGNIGNLHSFTVTGIKILRKFLEYGNNLFAMWQPDSTILETPQYQQYQQRYQQSYYRR